MPSRESKIVSCCHCCNSGGGGGAATGAKGSGGGDGDGISGRRYLIWRFRFTLTGLGLRPTNGDEGCYAQSILSS